MDTITNTHRYHAIVRYLSRDSGSVPCSRYGRNGVECAEVAAIIDMIVSRATGEESTAQSVNAVMGMVVNDHDEPALMLINDGPEHGIDAREWLGDDELERVIYELIPHYYDRETAENAATAHGLTYKPFPVNVAPSRVGRINLDDWLPHDTV